MQPIATPTKTTVTDYIGGLVYENDVLQFIPQEEGRIRFKPAVGTVAASLQYDYMLKDHLGNVRMVLTAEQQSDPYPTATMETAQAANEGNYYTNLNTGVAKPAGYPNDAFTNITNPNDRVAKLNGSGNKIGPSIILKVMAGDKFNVRVSSWYKTNGVAPAAPQNPLPDLLAALSGSAGSITANGFHGSSTTTEIVNSNVLTPGATQFLNNRSYTGTKPKAYLNWILLDEHFNVAKDDAGNIIASGYSGAEQVPDESFYGTVPNNTVKWHTQNDLPINKSGYLYVYVSNETPNIDVFFDNLQVTHTRGAVLEETHYYPFGLTMAGISSKAAGGLENRNQFNGIEQNKDFDLNTYDAFYRTNDPQIGRWWQIDPKLESFNGLTPYNSMGNNPMKFNDPLGDEFDQDSKGYVEQAKERINQRQEELSKERKKIRADISVAKKSGNKDALKSLKTSLKVVNRMSSELSEATREISVMEKSDQMFTVRAFAKDAPGFGSNEGVTTYSLNDKAVAIGFNFGNTDALIHELKHGYDFLQGNLSFNVNPMNIEKKEDYFKSIRKTGALYDVNDEVRAYNRSYSLNPVVWNAFSSFGDINENTLSKASPSLPCGNLNTSNTAVPKSEIVYKTHKN